MTKFAKNWQFSKNRAKLIDKFFDIYIFFSREWHFKNKKFKGGDDMAIIGKFKANGIYGKTRLIKTGENIWLSFWIEKGEESSLKEFFQKIKKLEPKEKIDGEIFLSHSPTWNLPVIEIMSKKLGEEDFSDFPLRLSLKEAEAVFQKIKEVVPEIEFDVDEYPFR